MNIQNLRKFCKVSHIDNNDFKDIIKNNVQRYFEARTKEDKLKELCLFFYNFLSSDRINFSGPSNLKWHKPNFYARDFLKETLRALEAGKDVILEKRDVILMDDLIAELGYDVDKAMEITMKNLNRLNIDYTEAKVVL